MIAYNEVSNLLTKSEQENKKLKKTNSALEEANTKLTETVNNLTDENGKLNTAMVEQKEQLENKIASLEEKKTELENRVIANDKAIAVQENKIANLELEKQQLEDEKKKAKEDHENKLKAQEEENRLLKAELEKTRQEKTKLIQEAAENKIKFDNFVDGLKQGNAELSAQITEIKEEAEKAKNKEIEVIEEKYRQKNELQEADFKQKIENCQNENEPFNDALKFIETSL